MSQSRDALSVGLSGIIGLALDDLPRSVIADELRRAAEILSPSRGVRFSMVDERMSIDPALDEPPMPSIRRPPTRRVLRLAVDGLGKIRRRMPAPCRLKGTAKLAVRRPN